MNTVDVVSLVESLYSASDSNKISEIQKSLQLLQKSEEGWLMAKQLSAMESLNCKFFGALTYTVKINQQKGELSDEELVQILIELVQYLIELVQAERPQSLFIIKKLLSNISLIYIQIPSLWLNPALSILSALIDNNQPLNLTPVISDEKFITLLKTLSITSLSVMFLLGQIVVEDISKNKSSSELHRLVHENFFHSNELLLQFVLTEYSSNATILNFALTNFSSWMNFASYSENESQERYKWKNPEFLIKLCTSPIQEISESAVNVLTDMLELNPTFFNYESRNELNVTLFETWGPAYLNSLVINDETDSINSFARLVVVFLDSELIKLSKQLIDDKFDSKFTSIISLTNFPGLPIRDELVSRDFIDFWASLAETYLDDEDLVKNLLDDGDAIMKFEKKKVDLFTQIALIYWQKIQLPENISWLDSAQQEYSSYRRDVADFYETIFPLVKLPLYNNLINNVIMNLKQTENERNVREIEASLYLINSISVNFSEDNINQEVIVLFSTVFDSNLLGTVSATDDVYLISATIKFLYSIDFFYKHKIGLNYLSSILEFIFSCLMKSNYGLLSSKAMVKICDDCRISLIGYLPNFENLLLQVLNNITVDNLIRERVIHSYASIIQSTKDPVLQGERLNMVIQLLIEKVHTTMAHYTDDLFDYLSSLLASIKKLGRAAQLPGDVDNYYTDDEQKAVIQYWTSDPLKIQESLLSLVYEFSINFPKFVNRTEITETCCQILKCGFFESIKGPFVFSVVDILSYIVIKIDNCDIDSVPFIYSLFDSTISSAYRELTPEMTSSTLNKIFIEKLDTIKSDPELIQASIDIFASLVDNCPNHILYLPYFQEVILKFCIDSLLVNEKFIIKSSNKFWTCFLILKKGKETDKIYLDNLMNNENLGQILTFNLLTGMLNAQRSDVDTFSFIFKALISKFPLNFKKWALNSFHQINEHRDEKIENFENFVQKLSLTRGQRLVPQIIKIFWLESNKLVNYSKR